MSTNKPGSQSINIQGGVTASRRGKVNITQNMTTGAQAGSPTNPAEFITEVMRLLAEVNKISGNHQDIQEAQSEMALALEEAQKPKPKSSAIRRFLNSAKSLLEDAADAASPAIKLAGAIATLAKLAPHIFGG